MSGSGDDVRSAPTGLPGDDAAADPGDRGEGPWAVGLTVLISFVQMAFEPGSVCLGQGADILAERALASGERGPVIGEVGEVHPDRDRVLDDVRQAGRAPQRGQLAAPGHWARG